MKTFRVLRQSLLAEQDFDAYPVWSEYYDYEELDDIEKWGLNRDDVMRLFAENSRGNEHCVYTMLESNPFPERMRLFIRATITTVAGRKLKGYIMNENAFCMGIFLNGDEFVFSSHPMLASENAEREQLLRRALGVDELIFPLNYETDFERRDGTRIAGAFSPGAGMLRHV